MKVVGFFPWWREEAPIYIMQHTHSLLNLDLGVHGSFVAHRPEVVKLCFKSSSAYVPPCYWQPSTKGQGGASLLGAGPLRRSGWKGQAQSWPSDKENLESHSSFMCSMHGALHRGLGWGWGQGIKQLGEQRPLCRSEGLLLRTVLWGVSSSELHLSWSLP